MITKGKKKYVAVVILALMMLLLCGCTAGTKLSVDTFLEMDENFKGQRSMSAMVPKTIFNQVFDGNLDELQKILTEKCPSTLLCKAEEVDNGIKITMTLDFANLQDYTDKIGQILGKTPGIYFDVSQSIFKKGYMIQENFSSVDLFGWLFDTLKGKYSQLEDKEIGDVFQNGKTSVIFKGEIIETTPEINVENMESHTFDSISVELTLNGQDSYGVNINFIADKDVYYDMGDDMDRAVKKLVPDGGVYEAVNVDHQRIYTIGFSAHNVDTLLAQLNSVLKTETCKFKVEEVGDESDPFKANKIITMYLDGSYFLDFGKENTEMIYKINVSPEYSFNECKSVTGFLKDHSFNTDGKYSSVIMKVGPSDEIRLSLSYAVDLTETEVYTKIINDSKIERDIIFKFDKDKSKLIGENFKNKLNSRMSETMKLEVKENSDRTSYIVHIPVGTPEEVSKMTTEFLDGASDTEMTNILKGGKVAKKQLKVKAYEFEDTIDFQYFLGKAAIDQGIKYQIEYPKGYSVQLNDAEHTNTKIVGNTLSCETKNKMLTVKTRGETANVSGMTQLVIWWISLILSIVSIFLNFKRIMALIKHGKAAFADEQIFEKCSVLFMTIGIISLTVFLFTSIRLLFRIY